MVEKILHIWISSERFFVFGHRINFLSGPIDQARSFESNYVYFFCEDLAMAGTLGHFCRIIFTCHSRLSQGGE